MQYKDLKLKKIRDDNGLDFAHFTYQRGMCSCCYGPKDLPKRYWRGNVIPADDYEYTYLLFKNADNGSGHVRGVDEIEGCTCIAWKFSMEKLEKVCKDLQEQVGNEYVVMIPPNEMYCIIICEKSDVDSIERHKKDGYVDIKEM